MSTNKTFNTKEIIKNLIIYTIGMFIMNLGITLTIRAAIGLSPISSVTRTMTVIYPPISHGTYSFLLNVVMFVGEFVVLPKDFKPSNFLQLIPAFISGLFLDLNLYLFDFQSPDSYALKLLLLIFGCAVLGFGLFLMIETEIILMPNDAFVSVVVKRSGAQWGNVKTGMDIVMVIASAALGLVFLGEIINIREGTIINAVIVGQFIKLFTSLFGRFFADKKESSPEAA